MTNTQSPKEEDEERPRRRLPLSDPQRAVLLGVIVILFISGLIFEFYTSNLQSRFFTAWAQGMEYQVEPGFAPQTHYPDSGPYDVLRGYTQLGGFIERLGQQGFMVDSQARISAPMQTAYYLSLYLPYKRKQQAGLTIYGHSGDTIYNFVRPTRIYPSFNSIPVPIVRTLLYIENRHLFDTRTPYLNPAIEWDRFGVAVGQLLLSKVGLFDENIVGGSTLITQLTKYRHSPRGITFSPIEKIRQMISASLLAYSEGRNNYKMREKIFLEYVNSVPLASFPSYGEVHGIGDGMYTWHGRDFHQYNAILDSDLMKAEEIPTEYATVYKEILSLFLSQRRPTYFLHRNQEALKQLTNKYINVMAADGLISAPFAHAVLGADFNVKNVLIEEEEEAQTFAKHKGANAIRTSLLSLLRAPNLYELDRYDMSVTAAINDILQQKVTQHLLPLAGGEIIHSFTLVERGREVNYVRAEADNYDQPFNINTGLKLDLGSTAKLRTLVTYLDIVTQLHQKLSGRTRDQLSALSAAPRDNITAWALDFYQSNPGATLEEALESAMRRKYSASPYETFYTGGGDHTFENFSNDDDIYFFNVYEALFRSINLSFIRMMRDITFYYIHQLEDASPNILRDKNAPGREKYLAMFADRDGLIFMSRFIRIYQGKTPQEVLDEAVSRIQKTPRRLAVVYRALHRRTRLEDFVTFVNQQIPGRGYDADSLRADYEWADPDRNVLQERAFSARMHPLELWAAGYMAQNPEATREEVVKEGAAARQAAYQWLFSAAEHTQNLRLYLQLEHEAFKKIHEQWRKTGYPFDRLVPSYATAIGSSADRPAALAELMGIIVNDGVFLPTRRIQEIHFAAETPYEVIMSPSSKTAEVVLAPEAARILKKALIGVVQLGTARRVRGAFQLPGGGEILIGGKTGTGEHKFETYGRGGQVLRTEIRNRSATFVFFIGDRYFGTVTAFVPGAAAANYRFTSSLTTSLLADLSDVIEPYIVDSLDSGSLVTDTLVQELSGLSDRRYNPAVPIIVEDDSRNEGEIEEPEDGITGAAPSTSYTPRPEPEPEPKPEPKPRPESKPEPSTTPNPFPQPRPSPTFRTPGINPDPGRPTRPPPSVSFPEG